MHRPGEVGGALGIAVLGSVLNETYRAGVDGATAGLPPAVAEGAGASFTFAQQAAGRLGDRGGELLGAATQAYVDGASAAMLTGAVVLVAGAVFVAVRAPGREAARDPARDVAPTGAGATP